MGLFLFKIDLLTDNETYSSFMKKVKEHVIPARFTKDGLIGLTNISLDELQKYTKMPLIEVTFEELKQPH